MAHKKSIRFFNDRQVRAVWDDENSKWWFSATDVVGAINDEENYTKSRNYWKYLKGKMARDGIQLVSVTNQFKFEAPDGKQRAADALDAQCVQTLAKHYPNNRAGEFLDWFIYSDNTIDGQSKKKAYDLFESGLLDSMEPGTIRCLQQIHAYIFGGLYDFAGQIRKKNIDLIFKSTLKKCVNWSLIDKNDYLDAMRQSIANPATLKALLQNALTEKINDRETFMKGIDYSYYYEQE